MSGEPDHSQPAPQANDPLTSAVDDAAGVSARPQVAVVGSGVAGMTAAYIISGTADVTVYEADERLGGHADTHDITTKSGEVVQIDTGFIVHNERTYPTLLRMFAELGVRTQPSEMSMSVRADGAHGGAGLEWAGSLGARGLFPTWRNLFRRQFLVMLLEIVRFHRSAKALLESTDGATDTASDGQTLAEFLDAGRFTPYFRQHFMTPLIACVWSCDPKIALDYPARYLFSFLRHHGMLSIFGSPQWRTVTGGSHRYVEKVAAALRSRGSQFRLGHKVTSVLETASGVEITDSSGETKRFDSVVIASHPDQALAMLAEPTPLQRDVLNAMPYSENLTQLHTDDSLMPRHRAAWSSWNQWDRPGRDAVTVTYDMTRLMRLPSPDGKRYFVTLGAPDLVDPSTVLATRHYAHPIYTPESVAAQRRLPEINTDRIVFAGAYHGWGFHEDGARSGAAAATRLGYPWVTPEDGAIRQPLPPTPQRYRTTIAHTRRTPVKHRFQLNSTFTLVDVDALPQPRLGALGRFLVGTFEARDHLGRPDRSIRENVESFLEGAGITLGGGRILMATHPRAWGYCFNPISVFWCWNQHGVLAATVVEVHNTYGDRHAYLVQPDQSGRATTPKHMYVSPFYGVDGHYELVVPVPDEKLTISVRLITESGEVFDASLRGSAEAISPVRAAPSALLGALLIRVHGIWLWARRVPIQSRPDHHQEGVS